MINKEMEDLEDEVKLIRVGDKDMSIKEVLNYILDKDKKKKKVALD